VLFLKLHDDYSRAVATAAVGVARRPLQKPHRITL